MFGGPPKNTPYSKGKRDNVDGKLAILGFWVVQSPQIVDLPPRLSYNVKA